MIPRPRLTSLVMIACSFLLIQPASAGNKGKETTKGDVRGNAGEVQTLHAVGGLISAVERAIIDDYLNRHAGALPPVFANATPLPPGIAKKIARGGTMPPGIAKKVMPDALLTQLPPRPGQRWLVVGTDLLVLDIATNVIVDILKGAARSG